VLHSIHTSVGQSGGSIYSLRAVETQNLVHIILTQVTGWVVLRSKWGQCEGRCETKMQKLHFVPVFIGSGFLFVILKPTWFWFSLHPRKDDIPGQESQAAILLLLLLFNAVVLYASFFAALAQPRFKNWGCPTFLHVPTAS